MSSWLHQENCLTKEYQFKNFSEAIAFVVRVGIEAEKANHHPDIDIRWNRVLLRLTTHDAGNQVTEKDELLAKKIEELVRVKS